MYHEIHFARVSSKFSDGARGDTPRGPCVRQPEHVHARGAAARGVRARGRRLLGTIFGKVMTGKPSVHKALVLGYLHTELISDQIELPFRL